MTNRTKRISVLIAIIMVLSTALFMMASCSSDDSDKEFSYSDNLDDNGLWKGIDALKYVELPDDYKTISIPSEDYAVTDDQVQSEIDGILDNAATDEQVTDRAVEDGDNVNLDYVGTIDGVEFEGGNSNGAGADLTAGSQQFIDDFLTQIIGHMPGETFDVEVTFPDPYPNEEQNDPNIAGKDAVFSVTINYITESVAPEFTDEFVKENLSADNAWNNVTEAKDGIREELKSTAIQSYIQNYLVDNIEVKSIPKELSSYAENSMIQYYTDLAKNYNVSLEELITGYQIASSKEELIEQNKENNEKTAKFDLIIQAIAEKSDISVNNDDLVAFVKENTGSEDYSQYEETLGIPYLMQNTLVQKVMDYLESNAKLL